MSNSTSKKTKADALALVLALIAGTQKHFPNGSFTLGNTTYTTLVSAMTAHNAAQANAKDTLVAEQGTKATVGPVLQAYQHLVLAAFSNATQTLADFGLTPPKARTPMTVEQKAAAGAKREATRAARHTLGPKQKKLIKGTVAATPPTVGAAQAPAPASASTASPAAPAKPIG